MWFVNKYRCAQYFKVWVFSWSSVTSRRSIVLTGLTGGSRLYIIYIYWTNIKVIIARTNLSNLFSSLAYQWISYMHSVTIYPPSRSSSINSIIQNKRLRLVLAVFTLILVLNGTFPYIMVRMIKLIVRMNNGNYVIDRIIRIFKYHQQG